MRKSSLKPNPCKQLPDLIFHEVREKRVRELLFFFSQYNFSSFQPGEAFLPMPDTLGRVTFFVTSFCQLRCTYCRHQKKHIEGGHMDFSDFCKTVDEITLSSPIEHAHLTGAEPLCQPRIVDMVRYLREKSIPVSITSNGFSDIDIYKKIVDAGVNEIRVSFDTKNSRQFNATIGRKGFSKILKNILTLKRLSKGRFYLIINSTIPLSNVNEIPELIAFVHETIKPDDHKLIPDVNSLSGDPVSEEEIRVLYKGIASFAPLRMEKKNAYRLLDIKLKKFFMPEQTFGLENPSSRRLVRNCFLPFHERTFDPQLRYYPCPIFFREGGLAIGQGVEDSFKIQQQKIIDFVLNNECQTNEICQKFCLFCTQNFNRHVSARIPETSFLPEFVKKASGSEEIITRATRYVSSDHEITLEEVLPILKEIRGLESRLRPKGNIKKNQHIRQFMIIKPLGIPKEKLIERLLRSYGLEVIDRLAINNWYDHAIRYYGLRFSTLFGVYKGLLMKKTSHQLHLPDMAKVLFFNPSVSLAEIKMAKKKIKDHPRLKDIMVVIENREDIIAIKEGVIHVSDDTPSATLERHFLTEIVRQ